MSVLSLSDGVESECKRYNSSHSVVEKTLALEYESSFRINWKLPAQHHFQHLARSILKIYAIQLILTGPLAYNKTKVFLFHILPSSKKHLTFITKKMYQSNQVGKKTDENTDEISLLQTQD